jgi:hypothetical protein
MQDVSQATLEAVIELKIAIARMEQRQENFLEQWKQHLVEDRQVAERVTKIESKLNYAAGVVTIIVAGFSFIANYIIRKLSA